jgi:hypothetical protein
MSAETDIEHGHGAVPEPERVLQHLRAMSSPLMRHEPPPAVSLTTAGAGSCGARGDVEAPA